MKYKHFLYVVIFMFGVLLVPGINTAELLRDAGNIKFNPWAPTQDSGMLQVKVNDFPAEGFILDVGGGGEGIIGQLKGNQVIAIDISKRELEEAPSGPLKIVMDARDLGFLDNTFKTATVFFTFMYIDDTDHKKVFQELHRVLDQGGRLLIWDVIIAERMDPKKKIAFFPLTIKLPHKDVKTGYGVGWPEAGRALSHYLDLADKTGFEVIMQKVEGRWFFIEMLKRGLK